MELLKRNVRSRRRLILKEHECGCESHLGKEKRSSRVQLIRKALIIPKKRTVQFFLLPKKRLTLLQAHSSIVEPIVILYCLIKRVTFRIVR